jgi:ATP-binding cassette subfamily B protein
MLIRMVMRAPILAVGGVVMAYLKSPTLSLVLAVSLPALFLMITAVARAAFRCRFRCRKKLDPHDAGLAREKLTACGSSAL